MIPDLHRHATPRWLLALDSASGQLPIADILHGSVFYPASGLDGRPVKYLGGFSHSFVYADCNVPLERLTENLQTFKGYRVFCSRSVKKEELCFNPFQPILPNSSDGDPKDLHIEKDFSPYALWTVYERLPEFDEVHGPERFSLLFVGGEGAATFQALYYSNQCAPSAIVLIKCDAFTGNWTQFFDPTRVFARSVIQNPHGTPKYLFFCDHSRTPPWPGYSTSQHTVMSTPNYDGRTHQQLRLWGRG